MSEPLEFIEIHHYYACSWIINQHGINQFTDIADIADEMDVGLRVRQMFTDQHGYVIYPFTVKVPDMKALRAFIERVGAGVGMDDWYIVNISYYEQAIPFAENLSKILVQMPLWEQHIRKYAEHNAELHTRQAASQKGE